MEEVEEYFGLRLVGGGRYFSDRARSLVVGG